MHGPDGKKCIKKDLPVRRLGGRKEGNPMWLASATSDRRSVTRVSVSGAESIVQVVRKLMLELWTLVKS